MLKWRLQSRDEALVPLSINCWPSASGRESYVNIEYESSASYDLQNVVIAIPLPHGSQAPSVNQVRRVQTSPEVRSGTFGKDRRKGKAI